MPVQSRKNKTAPTKTKEAPVITAEQVQKALELKIAALEAKLVTLTNSLQAHSADASKEISALKSQLTNQSSQSNSGDPDLRAQLKKYFNTTGNPKIPTVYPKL